jgi:hypothetical protein
METEKQELQEFRKIVKDVLKEQILSEETIDDFFNFLEKDPGKSTFAYVYYVNPVKVNKFYTNESGQKTPNPMDGKLFKNTQFMFNFAETYVDAVKKQNPDYEFGKRSGQYEKLQGYSVVETGKSGLYFPIIPKDSKSSYSIFENGEWSPIEYDEIKEFLPPPSTSTSPAPLVKFRQLVLDRIARISAKGNIWNNNSFKYKYLGPKSETFEE